MFICLATLGVVAIFLPICLSFGAHTHEGLARLARRLWRVRASQPGPIGEPPLFEGLHPKDPGLARVLGSTRALSGDLSDMLASGAHWPSDHLRGIYRRLLSGSATDYSGINNVSRDVWEWVQQVEGLGEREQAVLNDLGLSAEPVRQALLGEHDFMQRMRRMVAQLRSFEERLLTPPGSPYRCAGCGPAGKKAPKLEVQPAIAAPTVAEGATGRDEGAEARYQELLRDHGPSIRRLAMAYTRQQQDAEDLYQSIAMAVWRALPRFRGESSVRTYVFRIAHNVALSARAKRRVSTDSCEEFVDVSPLADEYVERGRQRQQMLAALQALPIGQRQVLVLHLEGLSYRETSEVLGITESNVSARLTRGRQALVRRLGAKA